MEKTIEMRLSIFYLLLSRLVRRLAVSTSRQEDYCISFSVEHYFFYMELKVPEKVVLYMASPTNL